MYKDKLRELRQGSRSLLRRVQEASKRPKLIAQLLEAINISFSFVEKMRNVTDNMKIFTDVEINSLESLANESKVSPFFKNATVLYIYQRLLNFNPS